MTIRGPAPGDSGSGASEGGGCRLLRPGSLLVEVVQINNEVIKMTSNFQATISSIVTTNRNSTKEYCYSARIRSTVLQGLPFGGVPTVLALDFMCFLALLFVFSILRKVAWDYGRLALVSDAESVASALDSENHDRYERLTSVSSSVDYDQRDNGFCSWLTAIFRIKKPDLMKNEMVDLVLKENNAFSFGRTTIANLNSGNDLLWLHTAFSFLYLLLTVYSMRRHTSKMHYREDDLVKRTLFITGLSKYAEPEKIKLHFQEAYPDCTVYEARLCYNVAKLMRLDANRRKAERSRNYYSKEETPVMINPKPCGQLCCCVIKGCEQENAVEYYTKLEQKLKEEYMKEKEKVYEKPLGMAFVTFQNEGAAARILRDFNACKCQGCIFSAEPLRSSYSEFLHTSNWSNPIITQFFPTVLLWCFSALLPTIVYYSGFFEAHWTRSGENRTTMHKCYTFLIFMVLILPSLGLSSLDLFFRWLFDKKFLEEAKVRFECVFLPDNGAFFVNYVIASAFIGNAMDLLRIPGLLMYMIRLSLAKSAAERKNVKRHQAYEFQFGAAYGWMMCVFTVVMTYSITCPIIVPFGLMYMLLKHLVDRYNLYYAYLPAKLDKKIHSGAVNQVVAAPILCLLCLLFFSTVRTGFLAATSMFTFVVLVVTIVICLSHVCFGHFKYLSAHNYKIDRSEVDGAVETNGQGEGTSSPPKVTRYIAQVLQDPQSEPTGDDDEPAAQKSSRDVNNEGEFQSCEDSLIENEVHH
ncbi:hypothetical protein chiPu_0017663 [Chiloscyllium punctatum]|uniref:CSC1/OSCA1-like 7TM region domain-containing protein n=1 Tax=Chiloscyllium punctatum TaxID=137246 RepID=A0A401RHX7_CHIPU|nr:hypothetical protein [Chiloscyllium punctatum]